MKKKQSFDEALELLEEIVEKMETEELPLEEALSLYKDGAKLTTICREKLVSVEGEILLIQKDLDAWTEEEFLEDK